MYAPSLAFLRQWGFSRTSAVSLHHNRLITGVGDLPPTAEGRVEGQPWREYQKEDSLSSLPLLRASTGSRAFCRAGCIDIKALGWVLRTCTMLGASSNPIGQRSGSI